MTRALRELFIHDAVAKSKGELHHFHALLSEFCALAAVACHELPFLAAELSSCLPRHMLSSSNICTVVRPIMAEQLFRTMVRHNAVDSLIKYA